jgi:hypothetical protein
MKADNIRDKEAFVLMNLVDRALQAYNLETQAMSSELPLNDEITLDSTYASTGVNGINGDNLVVYAVTKFSVVTTTGVRIKFLKLDRDDIYTLQDIIADEYQLDINL